jgi:lysozyme family protein
LLVLVAACKVKEEPKRAPPSPSPPPAESSEGAFVPGHVIAKTKAGATLGSDVLARHGLVKMKDLSGGATLYRVEGLDGAAPDARTRTLAIVDALRKDPNVEYAQLDHVLTFQ